MHDKGQIRLALGGQHPGGGKAGIVDQQGVVIPGPLDGVGGIGDDQLKGLVIPVLGIGQSVLAGDVELVKADVVEEHVDAAQVVGGDIDLLAVEATADGIAAQHLHRLQQQRAGAAGGVVDLVDLGLAHGAQAGQQLGHVRRCEELAAGFSGVAGVHGHQVLIGVAKGIDLVVLHVAQLHIGHTVEELHQLLVPLGHGGTQLVAVHVIVVKQSGKAALGLTALGGAFNVTEDRLQRLVQVLVPSRPGADVAEQLTGQDEEALFLHQPLPGLLSLLVGQLGVVKVGITGLDLAGVDVIAEVFRDVAVEHGAQHVVLEIPAVHRAPQLIRDGPDRPVQLVPLLLFPDISHSGVLPNLF